MTTKKHAEQKALQNFLLKTGSFLTSIYTHNDTHKTMEDIAPHLQNLQKRSQLKYSKK